MMPGGLIPYALSYNSQGSFESFGMVNGNDQMVVWIIFPLWILRSDSPVALRI